MFIDIILGANLKKAIDDVKDYFDLTQDECDLLVGADVGEGLLIIKDERIPIRFEPSELEMSVIKGKSNNNKTTATDSCFAVGEEYQWLVDSQKIIMADWCTGDHSQLLQQGYEKHRVQRVTEQKATVCYVPVGMVKGGLIDLPHLGKQSLDHYVSVVQLAALLSLYGFEDIRINHSQNVDLEAKFQGKTYAFEYEIKGSHTTEQLIRKKTDALQNFDIFRFVCSKTDAEFIKPTAGELYTLVRGTQVKAFVSDIGLNIA